MNPTGAALVYSTFIGGGDSDEGVGVAIDPAGNAYVIGETRSTNFPMANAVQATFGGASGPGDAFITKLSATGAALVYSTYLGGGNVAASVQVTIDGQPATTLYAGRAPGFVGLNQLNVVLPAGISSGTHTVIVSRNGVASNTVTIAVR